jgi:predicted amidohydrolase YtcJ
MSPLRTGLLAAGISAALAIAVAPGRSLAQSCPGGRLLLLTNGRIHTMDSKRTVVSRVRIAGGRFVEVGDSASASGGCTDTIDLRGRTVIPGMIDNHFHVQLVGSRPGYETRTIETAFSIAEAQAVIRERARACPGAFITAIGGLQPRQFCREPAADAGRALTPPRRAIRSTSTRRSTARP